MRVKASGSQRQTGKREQLEEVQGKEKQQLRAFCKWGTCKVALRCQMLFFLFVPVKNKNLIYWVSHRHVCSAGLLQCVHTGNACASARSALPPRMDPASDNDQYRDIILLCPLAWGLKVVRKRCSLWEAAALVSFLSLWHVALKLMPSLQRL